MSTQNFWWPPWHIHLCAAQHCHSAATLQNLILIPVPYIFYYFVLWPTNAQLFHKLSHCYMFRYYRVILRQLVFNTLPSYTSMSNASASEILAIRLSCDVLYAQCSSVLSTSLHISHCIHSVWILRNCFFAEGTFLKENLQLSNSGCHGNQTVTHSFTSKISCRVDNWTIVCNTAVL